MGLKDTQEPFPVQIICGHSSMGLIHVARMGDVPLKGDVLQIEHKKMEVVSREILYRPLPYGNNRYEISHVTLKTRDLDV